MLRVKISEPELALVRRWLDTGHDEICDELGCEISLDSTDNGWSETTAEHREPGSRGIVADDRLGYRACQAGCSRREDGQKPVTLAGKTDRGGGYKIIVALRTAGRPIRGSKNQQLKLREATG